MVLLRAPGLCESVRSLARAKGQLAKIIRGFVRSLSCGDGQVCPQPTYSGLTVTLALALCALLPTPRSGAKHGDTTVNYHLRQRDMNAARQGSRFHLYVLTDHEPWLNDVEWL
jgi:hypothetical protein